MKRSSYLHLKDEKIDCIILTDNIKYAEVRQMDERPSISGIYILYVDESETFVCSKDEAYNLKSKINNLYKVLLDHLVWVEE